jgi:TPP-dependent trihydroxycyclohexane-1,2-dione (THcHDO) dehydratase
LKFRPKANQSRKSSRIASLFLFKRKQYVERDGRQNRFIEGFWGIFGHGNVSGLGQGMLGTWWDVSVAEVSAADQTRKARESYEKFTKKQPPIFA